MDSSAHQKSLKFRSLAVISAIVCLGITSTTLSAGNAETLADPRPGGGLTKHATFSMY
ncbi:MAG: hypothetical protein ACE1ZE_02155 [Candidatus Binatia bacterium]